MLYTIHYRLHAVCCMLHAIFSTHHTLQFYTNLGLPAVLLLQEAEVGHLAAPLQDVVRDLLRHAVEDVLADRGVEEDRLLADVAHLLAPPGDVDAGEQELPLRDEDLALLGVVEALQQGEHGALAAAAGAAEAHRLPLLDGEGDALQDLHSMELNSTVWYGMVWHGVVWRSM